MGTKIKAILWTLVALLCAYIANVIVSAITGKPVLYGDVLSVFVFIVTVDYFEFKFRKDDENEKGI